LRSLTGGSKENEKHIYKMLKPTKKGEEIEIGDMNKKLDGKIFFTHFVLKK